MEGIQFEERMENGWVILMIGGRLDTVTAKQGEAEGIKALADGEKLAFDISALEYISSAGLRVLLRVGKQASTQGKDFYLVGATGMVREVLEDSGLDVLFHLAATTKELA